MDYAFDARIDATCILPADRGRRHHLSSQVLRLASTSHITLAGSEDLAAAPKATAIAVLTNTLDEWDEQVTARGLPRMQGKGGGLSFLTRNPGSAHDGCATEKYRLCLALLSRALPRLAKL